MGDQGGQTGGLTCETLEACDIIKEMIQAAAIQLQEQAAEEAGGGWADDATWVLTSSFVILTMQSGFGLLEIGNCMPGHEVNIMLKNGKHTKPLAPCQNGPLCCSIYLTPSF
jgi:hypothetical protein